LKNESVIIPWSVLLLIISGCAVVRTPYVSTGYFSKTVSRLETEKKSGTCLYDSLYAGFARVSITPSLFNKFQVPESGKFNKVPMAGYGQRRGKSATGIHDSLFVKAVALREGTDMIILVSADLLIMPPNITDEVILMLAAEGIQRKQVFFSATHSHSSLGGWAYGLVGKQFAGKENKGIENWLVLKIHTAVMEAIADLKQAEIGNGSFNAGLYTRNRLTGNDGVKNDQFDFIVIKQKRGGRAVIGTFSAHSTVLGEKNLELSCDYPGFWERRIESTTADMALFCGGSMGSQSPVTSVGGFEGAAIIGNSMADSIQSKIKYVKMQEINTFSVLSLKIDLPDYHFRLTQKRNLTTGLSKMLMTYPKNVYLQGIRIGNLVWIFTPGDFSGEYATEIKDTMLQKGFKAMISGYNGSYVGYIIPGKYFYKNHYETKLMGWFGPTMGDYTMDIIYRIISEITRCKK
jgi:neutral ceramidase